MIITKTPFRISFFGGGTDLPEFFREEKGAVISTTINKYVYVTVRHLPRFFDYTSEIKYSKIERVNKIEDIVHPMIRNAMKSMNMHELYISYDADLPGRTGLGTSSTFAVGLLNAFYHLKGKATSKRMLADDAIVLERELCNEAGGWQDQIAASFGGFNRIDFCANGYSVKPIAISPARKQLLEGNLMLFFTGFTRFSADIQASTKASIGKNKTNLIEMLKLVNVAQEILENEQRDLDDFGKLLGRSWELKKQTGEHISKETIDGLYDAGVAAGALGGKLLGAGGGGFLLFYVKPEKQEAVRKALKNLMEVPFRFEESGASVAYFCPETFDKQTIREQ